MRLYPGAVERGFPGLEKQRRAGYDCPGHKNVHSGDIVLFHNDAKYILEALPAILTSYGQQGLQVMPVGELLPAGETTIDAQGKQHPAAATIPEVH